MAGDWLKMRLDLYEDPAVIKMAESLDVREEVVVGYLHKVWSWVSRQCCAARVTGLTLNALGRVTHLPGFPEEMVRVGWLEYDDSGGEPVITIPHFDRHLSQTAKTRALAQERMRKKRSDASENGCADVAQMLRSQRNETVTREEKRRSNIIINKQDSNTNKDAPHNNGEDDLLVF